MYLRYANNTRSVQMLYMVGVTHPLALEWVGIYVAGGVAAATHTFAACRVARHLARLAGAVVAAGNAWAPPRGEGWDEEGEED